MSRADGLAVSDKAVQDFVLTGEVSEAEVMAGQAQSGKWLSLRRLRLGFLASLTPNGYIVFPRWLGGLILQWGSLSIPAATTVNVSFPLAFPSACWGVFGNSQRGAVGSGDTSASSFTVNGFSLINGAASGTGSQQHNWLSIGI